MPAILKAYEIRPMLVWESGKALEEMLFRLTYKAVVMVQRAKEQHVRRPTVKKEPGMVLELREL